MACMYIKCDLCEDLGRFFLSWGKMKHFKYKRDGPKPRESSNHCYYFSVEHFVASKGNEIEKQS